MLGLTLFVIGCIPTYSTLFYKFNPVILTKEEMIQTKQYDDQLLNDTSTTFYDLCAAIPMSMEQKLFYNKLQSIKNILEYRYRSYINMIPRTRSRSTLNTYYKSRTQEFADLLERINGC